MLVEEGRDGGFEFLNAAMNTATDLLLGQRREEALDLVQPGTAGRGQMHLPARTFRQPVADQRGLVRGIVVPDQMQILSANSPDTLHRPPVTGMCGFQMEGWTPGIGTPHL